MCTKKFLILFFFLHLACATVAVGLQQKEPLCKDIIQRQSIGENVTEEIESEVELWVECASELIEPDFSFGHDFIRLVTGNRISRYYEKASELYLFGLESDNVDEESEKRLIDELLFLEPFIGQRERRHLERLIERSDPEIYRYLASFWMERSLLPGDDYNERLLEHFERVGYAIKNYQTSSGNLFDDRGKTYIRFGEPHRTRTGIFMFNPGFVNYLITTRIDDGGAPGSDSFEASVASAIYMNTYYRVRDYHNYPSFEIWVYDGLSEGRDNVIYIFGNRYGGADMNQMRSVDDFIPSAAFSMSDRNSPTTFAISNNTQSGAAESDLGGQGDERSNVLQELRGGNASNIEIISPALILQMMYYRQLASLDFYFGNQYEEMLDRYMNTSTPLSRSLARQFQQTHSARPLVAQAQAPIDRSSLNTMVFDITPKAYPYLFYDENMDPYYKIFFEENVDAAISYEELRSHNSLDLMSYSGYELSRTLLLRNEDGEQQKLIRTSSPVQQNPLSEAIEQNVIHLQIQDGATKMDVYSELHNKFEGNHISEESTFRASLKGFGRVSSIDLPATEEKTGLFISDVILGYKDSDSGNIDDFKMSHDGVVGLTEGIMFYYEAYNLPVNSEGQYSYELTYRILRERSGLGRLFGSRYKDETSMTIKNTTDVPRFSQLLEIVPEEFQRGSYQLELSIFVSDEPSPVHLSTHSFELN